MSPVTIVDFGLGNILSVVRALEFIGSKVRVVETGEALDLDSPVILPGVGSFSEAMRRVRQNGLDDGLKRLAESGTPLLGICLGMQMLFTSGTEHGSTNGLCLLEGAIEPLPFSSEDGSRLTLPSVGWRKLSHSNSGSSDPRVAVFDGHSFYFVHSYHAVVQNSIDVVGHWSVS